MALQFAADPERWPSVRTQGQERHACRDSRHFGWSQRREWKLVPPSRSSTLPEISRVDDHTIIAVAPSGFAMPVAEVKPSCPWNGSAHVASVRHTVVPVEAVLRGRQQLDRARVEVISRETTAIHGLRFRLNRPVGDYIFLFAAGCATMRSVGGVDLPVASAADSDTWPLQDVQEVR
jgi:hypothetical protein